jgi:hypothetical protein
MRFELADVVTAFDNMAIGTRVGNRAAFEVCLGMAVDAHDTARDRAPGQHFIVMPLEAATAADVTCGVGHRTANITDFVLRNHRGNVSPFLRREHALPISFLACIVYTREAYMADPEVVESGEVIATDATHVIVAVLASADDVPNPLPRGTYRLAHCLAGGNNEADSWTLEEVREMCGASVAYEDRFCVVAD